MSTVILVVSWVLWAVVLFVGLGSALSGNPDSAARWMARTMGKLLILSCAAVALLGISKFWLLLAVPVAFITPMILMKMRFASLDSRIDAMMEESKRTGVPLEQIMERETKKLESKE